MIYPRALLPAAVALVSLVLAVPLEERQLAFDFNNQKVRGVNLGGWFVLEPWITPSIFQQWANGGNVIDEYSYTAALGKDEAFTRLNNHWATWITERDFAEIASMGLNHVRIPVGYWALVTIPNDPYVQGQLSYMDQAIDWARQNGLKIMLDIHCAPGSQNGFDNSGRAGTIAWQSGDNVPSTLRAIQLLAERYAHHTDVVTSIELLNEPVFWGNDLSQTKKFYYDGWGNVRTQGQTAVAIHDAYLDPRSWNGFMNSESGVNNVILDTHIYQVFSQDEVAMKPCAHVQTACSSVDKIKPTDKWTIVGEWTGAQTDCAKWLNGLGKGARYDGTLPGKSEGYYGSCDKKYEGTVDDMLPVDKTNIQYFIEAQLDAYESHTGWFFWNWKTESAPEWHFQNLTRAGLIPQPLDSRKVPSQCGTSQCLIPGN
ncbi:BgTH12-01661 [Blumeria graminis f. sp. triticale]|uniref:glucan 1,3-beta-glucosidase n=1 Tax=Blumeria graminis f. sp. triticale TaxID=1689686 RepID=A0A9W4CZH9_BLUGR|nr:BgTH12-01661 [Blumeria graminis f. sp. triticale]